MLGADSTSTYFTPAGPHYFNNGQKIFEIGQDSTLGIVTWGLGGLSISSHRMLVAVLADDLKKKKPKSVQEVAERWCDQFWTAYTTSPLRPDIDACRALHGRPAFDPIAVPAPADMRTKAEDDKYKTLRSTLRVGFCLAGYVATDHTPAAFQMLFDPTMQACPAPTAIPIGKQRYWGAPNMIDRLIKGCDQRFRDAILKSGKWNGSEADLDQLIAKQGLSHPPAPMRDAIDFTHACILSTIKALKFSELAQTCGGPIEIAVITVDRPFRWVRHKQWDAAITEGDP